MDEEKLQVVVKQKPKLTFIKDVGVNWCTGMFTQSPESSLKWVLNSQKFTRILSYSILCKVGFNMVVQAFL